MTDLGNMLKRMTPPLRSLDEVFLDLVCIQYLLRPSADSLDTAATDVDDALKRLDSAHARPLKEATLSTSFGKSMMATASLLLQSSAKDTCADEKVVTATRILADERLPNLSLRGGGPESAADASIANFSLLAHMSVVDSLEESREHVSEALRLWSSQVVDKRGDKLEAWLCKLVANLTFYDEALSLCLQAITDHGLGPLLWPSGDHPSASQPWNLEDELVGLQEMSSALEEHLIDEVPLLEFVESILTFVDGWPQTVRSRFLQIDEHIHTLQNTVRPNIIARAAIGNFLECCASFPKVPATVSDAVEEFVSKKSASIDDNSFFGKAIALIQVFGELPATPLRMSSNAGEMVLVVGEGARGARLLGSYLRSQCLVAKMRCMQLPQAVQAFLNECIQGVTNKFAEGLHLRGIIPNPPECPEEGELLPQWFDKCIDKAKLGDAVAMGSRVFQSTPQRATMWPSSNIFHLVGQLSAVVPASHFAVSLAAFCTSPCGAPQVSSRSELLQVCELFMLLSHVASTIAYISTKFLAGADPVSVTRDYLLKPELEMATMELRAKVNLTIDRLDKKDFGDLQVWDLVSWSMPLRYSSLWLQRIRGSFPLMCKGFVAKAIENMSSLAQEVVRVTPKVSLIINGDRLSDNLARKHMLNSPARSALNDKAKDLFKALRDICRIHSTFALKPALDEDEDFSDSIALGRQSFDEAKAAITSIAALHVILELKRDEQATQAQQLLQTKASILPKAILDRLQKIAEESERKLNITSADDPSMVS